MGTCTISQKVVCPQMTVYVYETARTVVRSKVKSVPIFFAGGAKYKKGLIPLTMETRCFHKKLEFQRYPPKYFCTARYEHKSSKKMFSNFSKTPKKNIFPGPILGQDRPEKTKPNVNLRRRDSESSTDVDRQNQRLRHEI